MCDDNVPIVIDNGNSKVRAGFDTESEPDVIIPNFVSRLPPHVWLGSENEEAMVGDDHHRGKPTPRYQVKRKRVYPIEKGIIASMNNMLQVW